MLLSQDNILSQHNKILDGILSERQADFNRDKHTYLDLIYKMKADIARLNEEKIKITNEFEGNNVL